MARSNIEIPTSRAVSHGDPPIDPMAGPPSPGTRFRQMMAGLAGATTSAAVGAIVLSEASALLAARAGAVLELAPGAADLVSIASIEDSAGILGASAGIPLASASPIARSARERTSFWVDAPGEEGRADGVLAGVPLDDAWLVVPLLVGDRAIGALALVFSGPRALGEGDRALASAIAEEGARALERVHLFQVLKEASDRWAALVHASPLAISVLDLDGTVRLWNPAAARTFGIPADRAIGGFWPAIAADRRSDCLALLADVANGAAAAGQSFRCAGGPDGSLDLEVWATCVEDSRGRTQCITLAADVTARAREENARRFLAESSAIFTNSLDYERSLQTLARLAVTRLATLAMIDGPRRGGVLGVIAVAHANPAIEQLVRRLRECEPPNEEGALARVLAGGDAYFAPNVDESVARVFGVRAEPPEALQRLRVTSLIIVPFTARGRSFGALTLVSTARPFTDEEFALARELGARVALHVDNARLVEEAREAVWLRDDFLGIAGHELKTPITALQLALQSLDRASAGPADRVAAVKRIALCHRQIERLSKLVDQLLDVSRITAGRLVLELEDVDVAEVLHEAVARMAEDFAKAGCEVSIFAEAPLVGRWDRMRLDQVVTNLLSNALKYGKGKPVALELRRVGEGIAITVRDEGIGIAPEDHARIFDRFERAVSQRNYGGLGLGLWIVHQIVEALGGKVRVQSAKGSGATFTVELPPAPSAAP